VPELLEIVKNDFKQPCRIIYLLIQLLVGQLQESLDWRGFSTFLRNIFNH